MPFSLNCAYFVLSDSAVLVELTHSLSPSLLTELRSFLQTLLDLLQRAEDYIRDKVDLTFFTQTLPQLVEHIYSSTLAIRERREAPAGTAAHTLTDTHTHTLTHADHVKTRKAVYPLNEYA